MFKLALALLSAAEAYQLQTPLVHDPPTDHQVADAVMHEAGNFCGGLEGTAAACCASLQAAEKCFDADPSAECNSEWEQSNEACGEGKCDASCNQALNDHMMKGVEEHCNESPECCDAKAAAAPCTVTGDCSAELTGKVAEHCPDV